MKVVLASGLLLGSSLLVHLVWWRISLPKRQTRALLVIFALVPVIVAVISGALLPSVHLSGAQATLVGLCDASCALTYIALYSAIEQQSPTLAIVSRLAAAGEAGCSEDELRLSFGQELPMANRLALMEQSAWLHADGDSLVLTDEGRFFARLFDRAANVFGLAKGG
jgi:hypothetical protein